MTHTNHGLFRSFSCHAFRGTVALVLATGSAWAQNVGYRLDGSGVFPGTQVPLGWDMTSSKGVLWRTELPARGNASPIVVGNRVYVAAEPDMLVCLDRDTGKRLWNTNCNVFALITVKGLTGPALRDKFLDIQSGRAIDMKVIDMFVGSHVETLRINSRFQYASMSPCSDGERIYVKYATGVVGAFSLDGKSVWTKPLPGITGDYANANLLLAGGYLLVQQTDRGREKYGMTALKLSDGAVAWENRAIHAGAGGWGSPLALKINGTDLAISGGGQVFNPADGKVLAETTACAQYSSIAASGNIVVVPTGHFYSKGEAKTIAFRLDVDGPDKAKATEIWSIPEPGGNAMPSLAHNGTFYLFTKALYAYSLDSGKLLPGTPLDLKGVVNETQMPLPGICAVGDRLVCAGSSGGMVVVWHDVNTFRVVHCGQMPRKMGGPPFFAGNRIYARCDRWLYCINGDSAAKTIVNTIAPPN